MEKDLIEPSQAVETKEVKRSVIPEVVRLGSRAKC